MEKNAIARILLMFLSLCIFLALNIQRVDSFPDFDPDLNHDGIVDIRDVAIAAGAFGSRPEDERWNPEADLNQNGEVDIKDIF